MSIAIWWSVRPAISTRASKGRPVTASKASSKA